MKNIHIPTIEELMEPDGITRVNTSSYLFTHIPYQGRIVEQVGLYSKYLAGGQVKTQEQWAELSKNKDDFGAPDAEILYQCLLRAYELRNNAKYKESVRMLRTAIKQIFRKSGFIHTLTRITYGDNLEATVSSAGPFPKKPVKTTMPEFTSQGRDYTFLYLASNWDNDPKIPENAQEIMQEILGKDYDKAGRVLQYFFNPANKVLKKSVKFSTPMASLRRQEGHGVIMGVSVEDFFIETCADPRTLKEPTIGVRIK